MAAEDKVVKSAKYIMLCEVIILKQDSNCWILMILSYKSSISSTATLSEDIMYIKLYCIVYKECKPNKQVTSNFAIILIAIIILEENSEVSIFEKKPCH